MRRLRVRLGLVDTRALLEVKWDERKA